MLDGWPLPRLVVHEVVHVGLMFLEGRDGLGIASREPTCHPASASRLVLKAGVGRAVVGIYALCQLALGLVRLDLAVHKNLHLIRREGWRRMLAKAVGAVAVVAPLQVVLHFVSQHPPAYLVRHIENSLLHNEDRGGAATWNVVDDESCRAYLWHPHHTNVLLEIERHFLTQVKCDERTHLYVGVGRKKDKAEAHRHRGICGVRIAWENRNVGVLT